MASTLKTPMEFRSLSVDEIELISGGTNTNQSSNPTPPTYVVRQDPGQRTGAYECTSTRTPQGAPATICFEIQKT
jgi:hypothetical protein